MQTDDNKSNEIVYCRQFRTDMEAYIAHGVLASEGIDSILDGEVWSRIYPGPGFSQIRLMVRRRDLERALQIVNSLDFGGEEDDD